MAVAPGTRAGKLFSEEVERVLREALSSIRYGTVTLVIQDGRVIQVDKNEKIRMQRSGHMDGSGI